MMLTFRNEKQFLKGNNLIIRGMNVANYIARTISMHSDKQLRKIL